MLDNINSDLKSRVGKLQKKTVGLSHLMPYVFRSLQVVDETVVHTAAAMYAQLISEYDRETETAVDIIRIIPF